MNYLLLQTITDSATYVQEWGTHGKAEMWFPFISVFLTVLPMKNNLTADVN